MQVYFAYVIKNAGGGDTNTMADDASRAQPALGDGDAAQAAAESDSDEEVEVDDAAGAFAVLD